LTDVDAAGPDVLELRRQDPERIAALRRTGLLDSEAEEVFDRLTRIAVRLLGVPAAFISLVDVNRDFYKSACGFGEPLASARELTGPTFCHYTVAQSVPLVIPDTAADPVYRDVPTVRTLGVAAYVGVPLVIEGQTVGALCTIDTKPRNWTPDEVQVLVELAASAQREMELRAAVAQLERANDQLQEQAIELELQAEELHATAAHLEERTEESEAANRAKSQFLGMMSHELRTPLNAIGGYAELLSMGVRGPVADEHQDYLSRIQRAAKHLQTLIGDILEFSRIDAGQVRYELQNVVAERVIEGAIELVMPQITESGISVVYDPSFGATALGERAVRADAKRLRQILLNLLTNAIKFTPVSGRVTVACEYGHDHVVIEITDTGRGIPRNQLSNIFEPFVQVDRTGTSAYSHGVGLGLAICRELARGMHGDLTVKSELGIGSTFSLRLPTA
jgi:signal transduction histidine kinase